MEFAYNNSYHSSIKAAPYEALYGRKCRSPICWDEVGERKILGLEIIQRTCEKVYMIRDRFRAAQSRQKSYYDIKRKALKLEIGDKVFIRVAEWVKLLIELPYHRPCQEFIMFSMSLC